MSKIITFITTFLLMTSMVSFSATEMTVLNDQGVEFTSGDDVCANREYFVQNDGDYKEILILDADNHHILDVINSNSEMLKVVFPENAGQLQVLVTPYDENARLLNDERSSVELSIIGCDYEVLVDDYETYETGFDLTYNEDSLTVTKNNTYTNYSIEYQFLDSAQSEVFEFIDTDSITIPLEGHEIIQILERYDDTLANEETKYYEVEVNQVDSNYFIRQVNEFEVFGIDKMDLINYRLLMYSLFFLLLIVYLTIRYRKVKSKYREEKIKKLNQERTRR